MADIELRKKVKRAVVVRSLFERANTVHRTQWLEKSQKGYDFYLNEQLTGSEIKQLEAAGMPTFTINRMTAILEIMKYFITANSPRWLAVGVEGSDINLARVFQEVADYCWYISNGDSMFGHIAQDALTLSLGYFFVDVDVFADRGLGECVIKRVDPREVFVDPASRDFMFRDASYIIIRKVFSRTQLMNMLPQHKNEIRKATGNLDLLSSSYRSTNTSTFYSQPDDLIGGDVYDPNTGQMEDVLDYYEMFQKVKVPYVLVTVRKQFTEEELTEMKKAVSISVSEFTAESNISLKEKVIELENLFNEGKILEERKDFEIQKAARQTEVNIVEYTNIVNSRLKDKIESNVAIEAISKKEFDSLMSQNALFRDSVVDTVIYFETLVRFSQTVGSTVTLVDELMDDRIHEYPLVPLQYMWTGTPYPKSAATFLVGKQQEINKSHQVMLHHANLSANSKWLVEEGSIDEDYWEENSTAPNAKLIYRTGFAVPTPVNPQNLNSAFFTITAEGKVDMEYTAGIQPITMGAQQSGNEPFRSSLARDENSTRRLKGWIKTTLDPVLVQLGKVFLQVSQSVYTTHKVFRIVQPGAGDPNQQSRELEVNVPRYNDKGDVIGRWNDYASARFDIRLVSGSTLPVNRWAKRDEYFEWAKAGMIDDIAFINEADIEGKDELIQRKSLYSQLNNKIAQLEEENKNKSGTIETLQRQVIQGNIHVDSSRAQAEISKSVNETKAQQKLIRDELKLVADSVASELKKIITDAKKTIDNNKKE